MQSSRYKRIYLIGLNLIILTVLALGLLLAPIVVWLGLFMITLSSNKIGFPDFIVNIEYILLIIFLPLCLALYFPIMKILNRRFREFRRVKEFFLPAKPDKKDRLIMISLTALIIVITFVSGIKGFLYFAIITILAGALRMLLILNELKGGRLHLVHDNRLIEKKFNIIRDWIRFLIVISVVILIVLSKLLIKKFN